MPQPVDDTPDVIDPEAADATPADALALRRPDVPVTLTELAARKSEAIEIIEARAQVWSTVFKAALRATAPADWIRFKGRDGIVTCYLQDAGCQRVAPLLGIDVYHLSKPQKVLGQQPGEFFYVLSGDGRCTLTGRTVEAIEGGRSSLDDVVRGRTGTDLELTTRKNARANLDGRIVRKLAGLSNVPDDLLTAAWQGTTKRVEQCHAGRGFGTQAERLGADVRTKDQPAGEAPTCQQCGAAMEYHAAGTSAQGKSYDAFWSCPLRKDHSDKTGASVDDRTWQARRTDTKPKRTAKASVDEPAPSAAPSTPPMTADEIPFSSPSTDK